MPLFKTNLKTAWAEGKRSAEAEIERVMPTQSAAHLAAPLMQAFGSDGPKRGKSLTQHDLVKWMLSQYEFSSKALKALAYQKIDAAIREALQVLEHAACLQHRRQRPTRQMDRHRCWTGGIGPR